LIFLKKLAELFELFSPKSSIFFVTQKKTELFDYFLGQKWKSTYFI